MKYISLLLALPCFIAAGYEIKTGPTDFTVIWLITGWGNLILAYLTHINEKLEKLEKSKLFLDTNPENH